MDAKSFWNARLCVVQRYSGDGAEWELKENTEPRLDCEWLQSPGLQPILRQVLRHVDLDGYRHLVLFAPPTAHGSPPCPLHFSSFEVTGDVDILLIINHRVYLPLEQSHEKVIMVSDGCPSYG
jgi:hypothetical protein